MGLNKMIRAYNLVSRGKPVEAEQLFESGEKLVDKLPFEYKLYKGVIKGHLQKTDETFRIFKQIWGDLDENNEINDDEKTYIRKYIYVTLKKYNYEFGYDIEKFKFIENEDLLLTNVRKQLQIDFPIL